MQLLRVREDEPARACVGTDSNYDNTETQRGTHLVPWPVVREPLGHMEAHPRRLHEEQGTVLSHLSLRRRHSAQDMAPLARLSSCSWDFADRSLSPSLRAEERGMVRRRS